MTRLRIDIVSDIVCPWCIIGFRRLENALAQVNSIKADIHWHPFELNPAMPENGQNLKEHLTEKYGTSDESSALARQTLTALGKEVGFEFNFFDDMRIYNTRKAHQLLMWSVSKNKQAALEMALFSAYFTQGLNIGNDDVLIDIATQIGLEPEEASLVIHDASWAETVSNTEQQWLEAGIQAVPAIVFDRRHLISGAQNTETLISALEDVAASIQHLQ